jgi:hypothetical protein
MAGAPSSLLAVCEGTSGAEQALGVLFAIVVVGVWAGLAWLCVWMERTPAERMGLSLTLVAAAIAGSLVILCFHVSLEALLLGSAAIAAAIGVAAAAFSRRFGMVPAIVAALLGDALMPLVVLAVLAVHVSLGPGCLGDELG